MAPDTQSIDFNAAFFTLGLDPVRPLDNSIGGSDYPSSETLSAAMKRVDLGDDDDDDDFDEDDEDEDNDEDGDLDDEVLRTVLEGLDIEEAAAEERVRRRRAGSAGK